VRTLRAAGTTIVLTTHYLEEAEALADRVAVIDKGALVGLDTPAALVRQLGRKQVRFRLVSPWTGGAATLPEPLRRRGATLDPTATTVICPVDAAPIGELLTLAGALTPAVADVEIVQPSLEDVFLQLTRRPDAASFTRRTP
jgi:ABC-2 type transport system ATP-binding protein